jgi:plastocyanin
MTFDSSAAQLVARPYLASVLQEGGSVKRTLLVGGLVLALGSAVGIARATQQPPPQLPAPMEDRVGFPQNYQTEYQLIYVFDQPTPGPQIRVVYGNDKAAAWKLDEPFAYGSILVMETYRAVLDSAGKPALDANGRYQRGELMSISVMRKEPGFGEAYQQNRSGEWEYVAYRPDGGYAVPPQGSGFCAACHVDTRGAKDWTYRTDLRTTGGSGAVPQSAIISYTFLPDVIRVKAGDTVTWSNTLGEPAHTVTAAGGSFDSGRMIPGDSFSFRFASAGTFEFACSLHPAMKGAVVVE